MNNLTYIRGIATGGPFDTLEAIRAIAQYLTQETHADADAKTLALALNSRLAEILAKAGYFSITDIANATDYDLRSIDGIGSTTLAYIRKRIPYAA